MKLNAAIILAFCGIKAFAAAQPSQEGLVTRDYLVELANSLDKRDPGFLIPLVLSAGAAGAVGVLDGAINNNKRDEDADPRAALLTRALLETAFIKMRDVDLNGPAF
ncbi:hypothetical protein CB0940_05847 [Cercospora beticola]|uniref:Uncharacterized protein n=1 Tax=Cercospora beticola TaxID=122368 RepID=A0A2G5HYC7_CERBT|nr:hypothetical protein CB0940_05847 [Cercospora beticola]PIA97547.1 hypothetical protein CB0940_05847 [Cercospora beticola]WPA98440.1 hypothetical protein RHO25_003052 [Cercospora beticola]CAK1359689.1 unnamed protein product [Cercospora beticola]